MEQTFCFLGMALMVIGCYQSVSVSYDGGAPDIEDRFYTVGDVPSPVVYDGVDLLVVIDNSSSMAEEQQILSTGFFSLINALTRPLSTAEVAYSPIDNMRLAVVTSDMGLQFGPDRQVSSKAGIIDSCFDVRGDDGEFVGIKDTVSTIEIADGLIACSAKGGQCPVGFSCESKRCVAESDNTVSCPAVLEESTISNDPSDLSGAFALQAACLIQQGTEGCGMEQQLEAGIRGLERHPGFIMPNHVLAVLVVSDEEDCSIEDEALFATTEWQFGSGDDLNVACNINDNGQYLMSTSEYRQRLSELKGDMYGLVFGAVVGVPPDDSCQGNGFEIEQCLSHPSMKQEVGRYKTDDGEVYTHFTPACTRMENGIEVTAARPGRRYVEVAQTFGEFGVVFSICNKDWHPALESLADSIALNFRYYACFHAFMPIDKREDICSGCYDVENTCHLFIEIPNQAVNADASNCPTSLYTGLTPAEKSDYMAAVHVRIRNGSPKLYCPVPNLPSPRECGKAQTYAETHQYENRIGWYYCENYNGCDHEVSLTSKGFDATRKYRRLIRCEKSDD